MCYSKETKEAKKEQWFSEGYPAPVVTTVNSRSQTDLLLEKIYHDVHFIYILYVISVVCMGIAIFLFLMLGLH